MLMMPGVCFPVVTIRFFHVGFSYQAHVLPAQGDDVGLPVAVDVGDLNLVAVRADRSRSRGDRTADHRSWQSPVASCQ